MRPLTLGIICIGGMLIALVIALTAVPAAPSAPNAPVATATPPLIEQQLAVIQGHGVVDQQSLTRITYDLDTLDRECVESRQTIGGAANLASDQLAKAGINESISSILDAELRGTDAAGGTGVQCNQILAAYVVLREHCGD